MLFYMRELSQKQYHRLAYEIFQIPRETSPKAGDSFMDYHDEYIIDEVCGSGKGIALFVTKSKHEKTVRTPYYKKLKRKKSSEEIS